jgi:hypothetical protein
MYKWISDYSKENPHLLQNEEFSGFGFPHFVHINPSFLPHPLQNFHFLDSVDCSKDISEFDYRVVWLSKSI